MLTTDVCTLIRKADGSVLMWLFPDPAGQLEVHLDHPLGTAVADEEGMGRLAREDVWEVLHAFGVAQTARATTTDSTDEVFLLPKAVLASLEVTALTMALMRVLPHTQSVRKLLTDGRWSK